MLASCVAMISNRPNDPTGLVSVFWRCMASSRKWAEGSAGGLVQLTGNNMIITCKLQARSATAMANTVKAGAGAVARTINAE